MGTLDVLLIRLFLVLSLGAIQEVACSGEIEQSSELSVECQDSVVAITGIQDATASPGQQLVSVMTREAQTDRVKSISYMTRIKAASEIVCVQGDSFVVVGELPLGGKTITIITNPDEPKVEGTLWAFKTSLSPSKRFLVYECHYPKLGPPEMKRAVLALYDFTKSFEENCPNPSSLSWEPHLSGTPIFPTDIAETKSYRNPEDHWMILSPILWSEDETQVVLVCALRDDRMNYLVNVHFGQDGSWKEVSTTRIAVENFVKENLLESFVSERCSSHGRFWLHSVDLTWKDKGTILITPRNAKWFAGPLEVPLPQD